MPILCLFLASCVTFDMSSCSVVMNKSFLDQWEDRKVTIWPITGLEIDSLITSTCSGGVNKSLSLQPSHSLTPHPINVSMNTFWQSTNSIRTTILGLNLVCHQSTIEPVNVNWVFVLNEVSKLPSSSSIRIRRKANPSLKYLLSWWCPTVYNHFNRKHLTNKIFELVSLTRQ